MSSETLNAQGIVQSGLKSLQLEYAEILDCLREMLASSSEPHLADILSNDNAVSDLPEDIDPNDAIQVFSIAFQLLDMVEDHVAQDSRQRRIQALGREAEKGLWTHCLDSLKKAGVSQEQIAETLAEIQIEPVFTAHPTEAKRPSVRERHRDIYELLCQLKDPNLSTTERDLVRERFIGALEALWHTGEVHFEKPTIERELRNVLYYLREVFPRTLESVTKNLETAWADVGFSPQKIRGAEIGPKLRFGLWIGGDRDGHPFVTADVTRETLAELRLQAAKLYRAELANIASHLSISSSEKTTNSSLQSRIETLADELGQAGRSILQRNAGEPWRQLCYLLRVQLVGDAPPSVTQFRDDLILMQKSLFEIGAFRLEEQLIQPILRKLSVFGFHLASLDVRQNSSFHDRAAAQLLEASGIDAGADYPNWPEEKRLAFLNKELESRRPMLHWDQSAGAEADAIRNCYRVLADYRRKNGAGLGSLIVSMTRHLSDLLLVHLFARESGLVDLHNGHLVCPLQVVPLFETLDDLNHASEIVDEYLSHPAARRSLELSSCLSPKLTQQIMLGYSDSNKDGGILASQWALHAAQLDISGIAKKHDCGIRFFHGRGGTISRGAGPTNWFLRSLPHGSIHGGFRMTEQGETIARKYAYPENATYHLESLVACVSRSAVLHRETKREEDPGIDLLPEMAEWSRTAYRALLESENFITFYRQATPIDALEQIQLGSRPSRRTGTASLDDLRAIPWVFSWTQSRFFIPGWFGVGSALEKLTTERPEDFRRLADLIPQSTLPRYIFTGVETNLLSADMELMKLYGSLVNDESLRSYFLDRIESEWELTKLHLKKLFPEPIELRRPRYAATLKCRNEPLRALHYQQVNQLRHWRNRGGEINRELVLLISAIASGLRSTG